MRDLLDEQKRAEFVVFVERFLDAIENGLPMPRSYAPITWSGFDYSPGQAATHVNINGKKVVLLTDAEPDQAKLLTMIDHFKDSYSVGAETFNLHGLDIKGSCPGCLRCGFNYECAYLSKDGFVDPYNRAQNGRYAGPCRDDQGPLSVLHLENVL